MARPKAANWIAESTITVGTGDITLSGSLEGFAPFSVMEDGPVYYTLQDGIDKECGIGTIVDGKIQRTSVLASFINGTYASPGAKIDLSGYAEVYCTVNADLFNEMNISLEKLDGIEDNATRDQTAAEVPYDGSDNFMMANTDVNNAIDILSLNIAKYSAAAVYGEDINLFALSSPGTEINSVQYFINPPSMAIYKSELTHSGVIQSSASSGPNQITIITETETFDAISQTVATEKWVVEDTDLQHISMDATGNTVLGIDAFSNNAYAKNNTVFGEGAGKSITGSSTDIAVGAENTLLGRNAGSLLTTGQRNVIIGHESGSLLTTGSYNIFIYAKSSSAANFKTGDLNVVIGYNAGKLLTSGERNSFYGSDAGSATTTGRDNVANGQAAMQNNTTGSGNTYLGAFAGTETGTGNNNTGIGRSALFRNVDGSGNVALGRESALGISGSGASPNNITVTGFQAAYNQNGLNGVSFYGMQAGYHATTMTDTVLVGRVSGFNLTTGSSNVMVGAATGDSETTGSQLVYIGHQAGRLLIDGTPANGLINSVCVGYRAYVSGSNQFQIGNSSQNAYAYSAIQIRSDERDKADKKLIDGNVAVSFVRGLESYFYKLNFRDDYIEEYEEDTGKKDLFGRPIMEMKSRAVKNDGSKTRERKHAGYLAQQVKHLMDSLEIDFGMYQDHLINGGCDVKTLAYEQAIPFITKALDVAFNRIEKLEANHA